MSRPSQPGPTTPKPASRIVLTRTARCNSQRWFKGSPKARVAFQLSRAAGWFVRRAAKRSTSSVVLLLALSLMLPAGCRSHAVKEKHFRREQRIRNLAGVYDLREKQSPENLRVTAERYREYEGGRGQSFEESLRWVAEHERERDRELKRLAPERHERIRTIFGGKPERIPDTWSDMVH